MASDHVEFPKGVDMIPQSSGYVGSTDPGHEMEDVRIRGVIIFLVVLVASVAVFQVMLGGMMAYFGAHEARLAVLRPDLFDDQAGQYAGPELQDSPNRDKPEIMRAWYTRLESYGWTDPSNKVARIPIDRAMTLLAERGIEKVPSNSLPFDVGHPENPNSPEVKARAEKAKTNSDAKAKKDEAKPKSDAKAKKDEAKATPAPDPEKSKN
jgi:hypothetical protein